MAGNIQGPTAGANVTTAHATPHHHGRAHRHENNQGAAQNIKQPPQAETPKKNGGINLVA